MAFESAVYVKDYHTLDDDGVSFADFAREKNFYTQLGPIFDALNPRTVHTEAEADFLEIVTQDVTGETRDYMSFLDLTCGVGRHALTLAGRGHDVTAVDYSQHLLDIAAAKDGTQSVRFVQSDLRDFDVGRTVDCAYSMWDAYVYLSQPKDMQAFASRCHAAVRPDGALVLDSRNYWASPPGASLTHRRWEVGQYAVERIARKETFLDDRVHETIYTIIITDKGSGNVSTVVDQELVRVFDESDLEQYLDGSFRVTRHFGDFDGQPYDKSSSPRSILVAQRV